MTTPAQRRFERATAAQAAEKALPGESLAGSNAYELMLAKLYDDKRRLKEIQSVERKIEVKREILPDYDNWISGVLSAGKGGQDDVLVTVMVWYLDVGNFDEALRIAAYVVQNGLTLPDQYQRNVGTVLVDEISDAALAVQKAASDQAAVFPLQILQEVATLTSGIDMPDQARAKLHKAMGYELRALGQLAEAKKQYETALRLDEKSGVKRILTELQADIDKVSKA